MRDAAFEPQSVVGMLQPHPHVRDGRPLVESADVVEVRRVVGEPVQRWLGKGIFHIHVLVDGELCFIQHARLVSLEKSEATFKKSWSK